MRDLRGGILAAIVAAIVGLVPIQGRAVESKEVSCDGFVLGYTGAGAKKIAGRPISRRVRPARK
jgi:hypothetical protein